LRELLCEVVDLRADHRVLDIAAGHGNTALAAAHRGSDVTDVDLAPTLLTQAGQRAAAEHSHVLFQEGDAEEIPFSDETFDVVLSTLGVPFASDQSKAAHELHRVCRGGGKIGLAYWAPTSASAAKNRIFQRYFPLR
jgi:ubiquinone/menaquinone biosynthesis C-methylase UbiE